MKLSRIAIVLILREFQGADFILSSVKDENLGKTMVFSKEPLPEQLKNLAEEKIKITDKIYYYLFPLNSKNTAKILSDFGKIKVSQNLSKEFLPNNSGCK